MSEEKNNYENYACGVFIVRADNANFNADFSHMPRELPDGRIYATDKSLKYCIRKYIHDVEGEDKVFMWRRFQMGKKDTLEPLTLDDNIKYLLNGKVSSSQEEMVKVALSKKDVLLFGATLAVGGKNISITGPCQITYGVNCFDASSSFTSAILSPYSSSSGKDKSTIGSESRANEVHYIYDFNINPNNLSCDSQLSALLGNDLSKYVLTNDDIKLFKDSITRGVNYVTSTTKVGAVGELLLFVEFKKNDDSNKCIPLVPLLKTKTKITIDGSKRKIDLSEAIKSLYAYSPISFELYYDPEFTSVDGFGSESNDKIKRKSFHIVNHKSL